MVKTFFEWGNFFGRRNGDIKADSHNVHNTADRFRVQHERAYHERGQQAAFGGGTAHRQPAADIHVISERLQQQTAEGTAVVISAVGAFICGDHRTFYTADKKEASRT